jgi:hypothetical protein
MCLIAYIMFSVVLKKALYVNVLLRAICIEQIGRESKNIEIRDVCLYTLWYVGFTIVCLMFGKRDAREIQNGLIDTVGWLYVMFWYGGTLRRVCVCGFTRSSVIILLR